MDIKQKLNDAKLIAKSDRRVWAVGGVILMIVLMFTMSGDRKARRQKGTAQDQQSASSMTDPGEAYKDLVKSLQADLANLASNQRESKESNERSRREFLAHKAEAEGVFQMVAERLESISEEQKNLRTQLEQRPEQEAAPSQTVDDMGEEAASVGSFGFDETSVPPPPPPAPVAPGKSTFISPGDIVPVRLLTGVAAPTDGTPYPVVFSMKGPITGPDGSSLDLGEARLIAAAQGSETDGRVIYRLTDLAIRHPSGRRSVVKIDGWVVGEDGVRGMRGKVIDKLGQLIAATAGYSFVAALGESIDKKSNSLRVNNSQDITVTGQDFDKATASALTDSSNRLGQLLVDKYEKQIPVVEVLAGRDAAAIFARGAEVSIIEDDDHGEGIYAASSVD